MKVIKMFIALLLIVAFALPIQAQSGGPYTVTWSSTNSGGTSSGGAYTLNAMLSSQGTSTSSGGGYRLGGVWAGWPEVKPAARLPIVRR
jgi:uncharacterized membrane protein